MFWKRSCLYRPAELLHRLRRNTAGQTMVEFALILPALILILLAIIQFGAVFTGLLGLNAAAREGARQAAVVWDEDNAEEQIKAAVERVYPLGLFLEGLNPDDVIIEYLDGKTAGNPVRVTVSGEITPFIPLPYHQESPVDNPEGYTFASPLKFSATAVMRLERKPETGAP